MSPPDPAVSPLLAIEGLHVSAATGDILRGADLEVERGSVTGVVGESGCGKTTLGLAVLGLLGRTRWVSGGAIRFDGDVVASADVDETAPLRGSRVAYIPQDPFRAFDPLRRVGPQVGRPLELHRSLDAGVASERVADLLERLGVSRPRAVMDSYPHELSGGLLQRAAIAAALSCGPELVIADEPTTALDAIVQVHVIDSFARLVRELGTSVLVITHDLRMLGRVADRIAAMYAGRVVEFGPASKLLTGPRHPYPAALLASSVRNATPGTRLVVIDGQPPTLPGTFAPCAYVPRCPYADATCRRTEPTYPWPTDSGVACHHPLGPMT